MKNKKFVRAVMIPAILQLFVFIVIPIIVGLVISFYNYNPLRSENTFVGFDNYIRLFSDAEFRTALKNTLIFVLTTVVLNIGLSLFLARMISRFKSTRVKNAFRMIFFLPCIAPMVATSVVFKRSIYPTVSGLLNMVLKSVGISSVNWLGDPQILMISVIIYTLWVDVGYNTILFSAGMDGIPSYVYEAADLDGTSEKRKFWKITWPLLGRTFQFVIVQTLISHFQMFAQFSVLIEKDGPQNSGLVLSRYIYKMAFEYKDMGYASAVSMILFLIILVVSFLEQRRTKVNWEY